MFESSHPDKRGSETAGSFLFDIQAIFGRLPECSNREVAQLASALRSGRRGRVFESPLPDKKGRF